MSTNNTFSVDFWSNDFNIDIWSESLDISFWESNDFQIDFSWRFWGSNSLESLSDVEITNLQDGQIIRYDVGSWKRINEDSSWWVSLWTQYQVPFMNTTNDDFQYGWLNFNPVWERLYGDTDLLLSNAPSWFTDEYIWLRSSWIVQIWASSYIRASADIRTAADINFLSWARGISFYDLPLDWSTVAMRLFESWFSRESTTNPFLTARRDVEIRLDARNISTTDELIVSHDTWNVLFKVRENWTTWVFGRYSPPWLNSQTEDFSFRVWNDIWISNNPVLDFGIDRPTGSLDSTAWIQARDPVNYASRFALALQPSWWNVVIGESSFYEDSKAKLEIRYTRSIPATSWNVQDSAFAMTSPNTSNWLFMWMYWAASDAVWIQWRDISNYASNVNIQLQPNGGSVWIWLWSTIPSAKLHVEWNTLVNWELSWVALTVNSNNLSSNVLDINNSWWLSNLYIRDDWYAHFWQWATVNDNNNTELFRVQWWTSNASFSIERWPTADFLYFNFGNTIFINRNGWWVPSMGTTLWTLGVVARDRIRFSNSWSNDSNIVLQTQSSWSGIINVSTNLWWTNPSARLLIQWTDNNVNNPRVLDVTFENSKVVINWKTTADNSLEVNDNIWNNILTARFNGRIGINTLANPSHNLDVFWYQDTLKRFAVWDDIIADVRVDWIDYLTHYAWCLSRQSWSFWDIAHWYASFLDPDNRQSGYLWSRDRQYFGYPREDANVLFAYGNNYYHFWDIDRGNWGRYQMLVRRSTATTLNDNTIWRFDNAAANTNVTPSYWVQWLVTGAVAWNWVWVYAESTSALWDNIWFLTPTKLNWFWTTTPTSTVDIDGVNGYNQLRLRLSYTPTSTADANWEIGDTARDDDFVYKKTNVWWKRAALSTF